MWLMLYLSLFFPGLGVEDAISAKIVYDAHMSKPSAGDK